MFTEWLVFSSTEPICSAIDAVKVFFVIVDNYACIMFLITAGTGFGVICSIWMTSRHLFDERHRLCIEKLKT